MDTRNKRASALACGLAFLVVLPSPDGLALDQGDRQQTAYCYRGILAAAPIVNTPEFQLVQGAYGFRSLVQGSNGFNSLVQGANGQASAVEGAG